MKKRVICLTILFCFFVNCINVLADSEKIIDKENIYEKRKVNSISNYSYDFNDESNNNYISPEVLEKIQEMKDYEILLPKTNSKYEIALAYEDGSYSFVDSYNNYDDALVKINEIEKIYNDNVIIPTIINDSGQVVYATNSMGRVWKHIHGEPYQGVSLTSSVYPSATSEDAAIVINQNSVDDVAVIEENGKRAKIQVNGYKGWVNIDTTSSEYDLVLVPINQVTNPSCYLIKNGYLYHYISYNMTDSNDQNGYSIRIGKAPSFMEAGIEYYSYDGVYFYSGSDRLDGLVKLTNDLKNNTTANAVNNSNPYYNYYQYLPFRTKTSYTAEQLNSFIINNPNVKADSKLIGLGEVLIECQEKYGVNPLMVLGIAINESGWGSSSIAKEKNNLFGLGAIDLSPGQSADAFNSPQDCVREFAYYWISRGYADPQDWRYNGGILGNKAIGVNVKYASDPYWGEKAAQHTFSIDLSLSDGQVDMLNDYDGYQLVGFNKGSSVLDKDNNMLYNISKEIACEDDYYIFNVAALKFDDKNEQGTYEIFADRTDSINSGEYEGTYQWGISGFINGENIININKSEKDTLPGYLVEDINRDNQIDINDLSLVALKYDKRDTDAEYKRRIDINFDGIIDIFDIVLIGKRL